MVGSGSDRISGFGLVGSELHDPEGWVWRQKRQTEEQNKLLTIMMSTSLDEEEEHYPYKSGCRG